VGQEDHLRPGVQDQPEEHRVTPSQKEKEKKRKREMNPCHSVSICWLGKEWMALSIEVCSAKDS
jgi:hypothetical protein